MKFKVLKANFIVFLIMGAFAFWPINTSVWGTGIARSRKQITVVAPTSGFVDYVDAFPGQTVKKGQLLLRIAIPTGEKISISSAIDGKVNWIDRKCLVGSYLNGRERLLSIFDPEKFSVLCLFPIRQIEVLKEGRPLQVYPAGEIHFLAGMKSTNYSPAALQGSELSAEMYAYDAQEALSNYKVQKYFGVQADVVEDGKMWPNEDGMLVNVLLRGKTEPLLIVMAKKFLSLTKTAIGIFGLEPGFSIFLAVFLINYLSFIYNVFPLTFIFWFSSIREMGLLIEQKERAKVPLRAPSASMVIPAYNETKTIVSTVNAVLGQNYPLDQIVIVDDGSRDGMAELLIHEFGLEHDEKQLLARKWVGELPTSGDVVGIFSKGNLVLLQKENAGKGYAMNAGFNFCGADFICVFDADTIPDPDGVLDLVFPMIEDPQLMVTSGRNQFVNGAKVEKGKVVEAKLPANYYLLSQINEFFDQNFSKAFLNAIGAQIVLVGNFSCFRRSHVIALNGFAERGLTEDFDFNLQSLSEDRLGRPGKAKAIVTARGWTQAPYTLSGVIGQRARWSGGILQSLSRFRFMLFNPKFGALGMYVLPRRWYGILTFPVDFLIKFLGFPLGVYFYFTSPSGKILFWDIFFYYYLVALIRNLLVNGVLVNYFDWLFIRTFKTKREYIFLTFFRIFTGFIFDSLQMVCNLVGYWRTIIGTGIWGKMERSALQTN